MKLQGRPPVGGLPEVVWCLTDRSAVVVQPATASATPAVQCAQVGAPAQQRSISTIPEGRSTPRIERNIAASFPWDQRRQPAGIGARAGIGVGRHGTS
jgi:hypothetical protein